MYRRSVTQLVQIKTRLLAPLRTASHHSAPHSMPLHSIALHRITLHHIARSCSGRVKKRARSLYIINTIPVRVYIWFESRIKSNPLGTRECRASERERERQRSSHSYATLPNGWMSKWPHGRAQPAAAVGAAVSAVVSAAVCMCG